MTGEGAAPPSSAHDLTGPDQNLLAWESARGRARQAALARVDLLDARLVSVGPADSEAIHKVVRKLKAAGQELAATRDVDLWFAYLRRHSSRLAGVRAELEGGAGR